MAGRPHAGFWVTAAVSPASHAMRRALVVGALGIAVAVVAIATPELWIERLLAPVDPDRTVRPLPVGTTTARFALGLALLLGGGVVWALRRWFLALQEGDTGKFPAPITGDQRAEWTAVLALFALGFMLRAVRMTLPLEFDEATTYVMFASRSLLDAVSDYSVPNNHVLHSIFLWFSTQIFGTHAFSMRALAFMAGVAAIPLTYWVLSRAGLRTRAVACTALVAVAPPFVELSARARGYSLQFLFFLWFLYAAWELAHKGRRTAWLSFVLSSALGLYTIPSFILPLGGVGLWLLLKRRDVPFLMRVGAATAASAVLTCTLYLPVMLRSGAGRLLSPGGWEPLEAGGLLPTFLDRTGTAADCWTAGLGFLGGLALVCGAAALIAAVLRKDPWARLVVVVLIWLALFTLLRRLPPVARTLHWLLPLLLLGATGGFGVLAARVRLSKGWQLGLIVGLAAAWGVSHRIVQATAPIPHPSYGTVFSCVDPGFLDAEDVAQAFASEVRTGDLLVVPRFMGLADPIRIHLMNEGLSTARLYEISSELGPTVIGGFPRWFVAAPPWALDETGPADADTPLEDVANLLSISVEELDRVAERIEPWRDFAHSRGFVVYVRPEIAANTEPMPGREIVQFAW